jgi:ubiquinone/menaquinone biosynthesis C-methylase UbiE
MTDLGSVDHMSHYCVHGWAAIAGDPTTRLFVRVFVDGEEVGTTRADLYRADLRTVGISDGHSAYRFVFSRAPDPFKDHLIEVRERDSGAALPPGSNILPSLLGDSPASMLTFDSQVATADIRTAVFESGVWRLELDHVGPASDTIDPVCRHGTILSWTEAPLYDEMFEALGLARRAVSVSVYPDAEARVVFLDTVDRSQADGRLRIAIPAAIPPRMSQLSDENMTRVAGDGSHVGHFAATGVNTAHQIDGLIRRHFNKGFDGCGLILDWGIGSGRVAMQVKDYLAPNSRVVGSDVDSYNIAFGQEAFPDLEFIQSDFEPPLPFGDGEFDAAYGVSVFTHLTETAQTAWLKELRRVVKRGAPVIMTVHGQYAIWHTSRHDRGILDEMIRSGISDRTMDMGLGPKLSNQRYYRDTYHTRKYIELIWGEYFEILGYYSSHNLINQDYVVMTSE